MKRYFSLFVLLLIACAGVWPHSARGQVKTQSLVLHSAVDAKDESLDLNVLFTVLDSNGQALPKEAIKFEGEGNAFGPGFEAAPATVAEATTPIRIALVIDASGSMAEEINDVRNAAINFVGKIPSNAQVAVFKFAENVEQVQGFTTKDQIGLVQNAILTITNRPPGTGNTCIFLAARDAIKAANAGIDENNVARPAVVLFTDGKDSEAGDCGPIKQDQVVTEAKQAGLIPTQVHTIGLCNDDACSNVNRDALSSLASNTNASTKAGKLGDLENLFNAILAVLNTQFMATTSVKPRLGDNPFTIQFDGAKINDAPAPVALTSAFVSPRDYGAPATKVVLVGRTFDPDTNEYTVTMNVVNPEQVDRIVVLVRDAGNNTVSEQSFTTITESMVVTHPPDGLKEGADFFTDIKAFDKNGQEITSDEGKSPLATMPGKFVPRAAEPLSFEYALQPEFNRQTGEFEIKLSQVQSAKDAKLLFKGSISEGTRPVMQIPEGVFNGSDIKVRLVDAELSELQQAQQPKTYTISLTLSDPVSGVVASKDTPTTVAPAARVGFVARILATVRNPAVLGSILVIVVLIAAVAIILTTRKTRRDIPLPSPFNEATGVGPSGGWQQSTPARPATPSRAASSPGKPAAAGKAPSNPIKPPSNPIKSPSNAGRQSTPGSLRPMSAPVGGATMMGEEAAPPTAMPAVGRPSSGQPVAVPEALITIVATPEPALNQGRVARELPFVIGRENCSVVISGDRKISRQHVEVSLQGNKIMVKDLDSANGTTLVVPDPPGQLNAFAVKQQLARGASVEWDNHSLLRLGPNTVLRLMLPGWPPKDDDSSTMIDGETDNRTQIAG